MGPELTSPAASRNTLQGDNTPTAVEVGVGPVFSFLQLNAF